MTTLLDVKLCVTGLIVICAGLTQAIMCYECTSEIYHGCRDDFRPRGIPSVWTVPGSVVSGECILCYKVTVYGVTVRGCETDNTTYSGCYDGKCYCANDLCNSAVSMETNLTTRMIMVLVSAILFTGI